MPATAYNYHLPTQDARRDPARTAAQGITEVEQIWGTQQEVCRLYALGLKEVDIARELGLSPVTVGNVVNSSIGRRRILQLQGGRDRETIEISDRLKQLRSAAVDALASCLQSGDEKVVLKAAEGVLNRTGFAPGEQSAKEDAHMSDAYIEELKLAAAKHGYRTEVIDITSDEVTETAELAKAMAAAEAAIEQ